MQEKNIALIHTGGTIGMERTQSGYAPVPDFARRLTGALRNVGALETRLPHHTLFEYATPIDSSNATPTDWQKIANDIAARYANHDGFVVLHGTDTMAFTASALSFMLRGLRKPIIVTGAQIPLSEAQSDALPNVSAALQLAAMNEINEVAICFNQRLLRGNRSTKVSAQRLDAFDSPNCPPLAEGASAALNPAELLPRAEKENFQIPEYAIGRILSLRFAPGMPVAALQAMLALKPQALILECYGNGNAPDNDVALIDSLTQAHAAGILLVACKQVLHGRVALGAYATSAALARIGVIGTVDMTFEAAFTKLHHLFALGLPLPAVRGEFVRNWCGELTE
jgi:L-asparaginase